MTNVASMRPPEAPGSRYDAIVIGAGLSGLTAAASLAQAGARVPVCEQADQVAGRALGFFAGQLAGRCADRQTGRRARP